MLSVSLVQAGARTSPAHEPLLHAHDICAPSASQSICAVTETHAPDANPQAAAVSAGMGEERSPDDAPPDYQRTDDDTAAVVVRGHYLPDSTVPVGNVVSAHTEAVPVGLPAATPAVSSLAHVTGAIAGATARVEHNQASQLSNLMDSISLVRAEIEECNRREETAVASREYSAAQQAVEDRLSLEAQLVQLTAQVAQY
jgi:hypothetical protein